MNILITNDDGITSEGLRILHHYLRTDHDVWIVAPDRERSAVSHGITFREPVKFHRLQEKTYSCSGTPADCVMYTCHGAIPFSPDLVVSGINRGENIGTDIIYSGTVAAARQAVLHGIPGVALSCQASSPSYHEAASLFVEQLPKILEISRFQVVVNINVPDNFDPVNGIVPAVPSLKQGGNSIHPYYRNDEEIYCFLSDFREELFGKMDDFSDADALSRGYASITPLVVQPASHDEGMKYCLSLYPVGGK